MTETTPLRQLHPADLEAFLDFVNTQVFTDGRPDEGLSSVEAAVDFLAPRTGLAAEVLSAQAARDPAGWLRRVHDVRAALRETWDAQVHARSPDPAAVSSVNRVLVRQPALELRPGPTGVDVGRRACDDPAGEALARLIEPFVEALARGEADRFRVCANDGCRWVFEDTSRGRRRRWCEMASCGNRAKVARYRARRRVRTVATPDPAPAFGDGHGSRAGAGATPRGADARESGAAPASTPDAGPDTGPGAGRARGAASPR